MFLVEEAWNAYPHCKTVLVNGYFKTSTFRIDVETMHVDDKTDLDNAVGLSPDELKKRKVRRGWGHVGCACGLSHCWWWEC